MIGPVAGLVAAKLGELPSYSFKELTTAVGIEAMDGKEHKPSTRVVLVSEATRDLILKILRSIEEVT